MEKLDPSSADKSNDWMQEALNLAYQAASEDEVPVGAIVIYQGKVVGRGHNRRERDRNPVSHAEIEAIQEAARSLQDWRLNGCTLYVTLEPCPMCLAACQQARIDSVVYGAIDPKGGAHSLGYKLNEDTRINHRFPVNYVERAECGQVLRDFFAMKRAKSIP